MEFHSEFHTLRILSLLLLSHWGEKKKLVPGSRFLVGWIVNVADHSGGDLVLVVIHLVEHVCIIRLLWMAADLVWSVVVVVEVLLVYFNDLCFYFFVVL